jgi:hypothetical protein
VPTDFHGPLCGPANLLHHIPDSASPEVVKMGDQQSRHFFGFACHFWTASQPTSDQVAMKLESLLAVMICWAGLPVAAQTAPEKRQELESIVREYILQHPEVLVESVRLHQEREREARLQRSRGTIVARASELFDDPSAPVAGKCSKRRADRCIYG